MYANLKWGKVFAYDVSGERIKGSIDLALPYLQACLRE